MKKILIIEDDITFGVMLKKWFNKNNFEVMLTETIESGKKEILCNNFSLILSDLRLPDSDGIMLLAWLKENRITIPVILMTGYGEVQTAVSAMKLGAYDFLEKPVNPDLLKQKIELAIKDYAEDTSTLPAFKEDDFETDFLIGKSALAQQAYEHIEMVAPTKMSVLLCGETGTGKDYIAQLIHHRSPRKMKPFIAVDCSSLSHEMAASELFGHKKGAFPAAVADKKGAFELANSGTIFLDEIGNLPEEVQMQLMRTLQEKKVYPVGAGDSFDIDVRMIAATNENLEKSIKNGRFREDLYHKINEFVITMPPLRDRKEDIPIFAMYFLARVNKELDKNIKSFSKETLDILELNYWSGNMRELENTVRRAALFAKTDEILPENLPVLDDVFQNDTKEISLKNPDEKEKIEKALKMAYGNKSLAAKLLQVDRKTLYNKMHQYDMI